MSYRRLFVLVEGNDDERFFGAVLQPVLAPRYQSLHIWKYSQERDERQRGLLRSIRSMDADYLYLADVDFSACPVARKQEILARFPHELSPERVVIVVKEIESWYLAGVTEERAAALKLTAPGSTDQLTKEQFNQRIPARFHGARVDYLVELLKGYSLDLARQRNRSLCYFLDRHC